MNKKTNRLTAILVVIMTTLMMMSTTVFATADPPVTPPATPEKEPAGHAALFVKQIDMQFFTQGVNNILSFEVGNDNSYTAKNVKITAEGIGDYADKFTIIEGTNAYYAVDYITTKRQIQTQLKIDASVPDGVYKLNIKFNYKTMDNADTPAVTETCIIYVNGSSESRPYVKSVKFDKAEIGKDNKAKMVVELVNPTNDKFDGVKLGLRTSETKDFTLYENFQPQYVAAIEPNSTKSIEFSVYVAPAVVTGNYPVAFDLSFRDRELVIHSYICPVYTQVKRTADADGGKDGSTPRIIISKYSTDTEEIKAGKTFVLDFTLENTSANAVGNMKVTVGSETVAGADGKNTSAVFFPAEGSNSFFIQSLGSKQTISKKIKLMAKQDVEPGVYPVNIDIDYEDSGAKQFKSQESIAFNVSQEQRLEIIGFNMPTNGSTGMMLPVSFQYINKGKSTINNVTIAVDGDFTLEGGNQYIGNLTAGFNDYFDGGIVPTGEGSLKGAVVLKFEDSQGNEKEIKHDITAEIMAMDINMEGNVGMGGGMTGMVGMAGGVELDPKTGMPIDPKTGMPLWGIIAIIVVVLGAGATAFLIIRKKLKAKKEMLIDEED